MSLARAPPPLERQRQAAVPQASQKEEQAGSRPGRQNQADDWLEQGVDELRWDAHGSVR